MSLEDVVLVERFPGIDDYRRMRASTGLSAKSAEASARGLANTTYGVSLLRDGNVVGMGRIVGDGGCFHFVVDIAVDPQLQGRGLGKRIMDALDAWLRANAEPTAHVSLFADGNARHLYARYGFAQSEKSVGMFYRV
ncbi:MAG TPA: GNAT family N-acetyltransferase [Thermomonas sp.]|jgi:GNAT superfamily N-acetyltransferase|uniref:GNAT family N-acetyltransferase n=1 Tax=Thermomonas sp. TaxID=1971895 RepID=UPI002BC636AD|nr:GNAT family N-acetyltransferase [Thermomonas sp.]